MGILAWTWIIVGASFALYIGIAFWAKAKSTADFYAAEYIDKLDELKININERQAVAESAASALGRKTDEILIAAMDAGANATQIADVTGALAKADLLTLFETFGAADAQKLHGARQLPALRQRDG